MASLFKKPVDKLLDEEGRPYTAFIPGRSGLIAIEAMAIQELLFPSSESPLIEPKESTRNQRVADGNIKYYIGNKALLLLRCDNPFLSEDIIIERDIKFITGLVQHWISDCLHKHTDRCTSSQPTKNFLPTRLLRIGSSEHDDYVALVSSKDLTRRDDVKYVALSHCWGPRPHPEGMTTTTGNIEHRQSGFELSKLPENLAEAATLTRALGLQYIWIDSLCILQDSTEDWETESSVMGLVYQNALFTLGSSSKSAAIGGCLNTIVSIDAARVMSTYYSDNNWIWRSPFDREWEEIICANPLSNRAWCLQEYELSPRFLSLSPLGLLWRCRSEMCLEKRPEARLLQQAKNPHMDQSDYRRHYFSGKHAATTSIQQSRTRRLLDASRDGVADCTYQMIQAIACTTEDYDGDATYEERSYLFTTWGKMVEEYGLRGLTKEEDKLAAISGLAHEIGTRTGGTYYAGLWKEDFVRGLLWGSYPPVRNGNSRSGLQQKWRRPQTYVAPSWSWASVIGPVSMMNVSDSIEVMFENAQRTDKYEFWSRIEVIDVEPAGRNPYGAIKEGASLTILSWWRKAKIGGPHTDGHSFWLIATSPVAEDAGSGIEYPSVDSVIVLDVPSDPLPEEVFCLEILGNSYWQKNGGLALVPVEGSRKQLYRRVGCITFGAAWFDGCKMTEFTII